MRDYLNIGSVPFDCPCAQVGRPNYAELSRVECRAFTNQCKRLLFTEFGKDYKCEVRPKSFPHDFGSYLEVVAFYDDNSSAATEQAFWLEANMPESWDKEALDELRANNYTLHMKELA